MTLKQIKTLLEKTYPLKTKKPFYQMFGFGKSNPTQEIDPNQYTTIQLGGIGFSKLKPGELSQLLTHINTNYPNVQELSLARNGLTQVPREVAQFQNLTKLNISGNPIRNLSTEITAMYVAGAGNLDINHENTTEDLNTNIARIQRENGILPQELGPYEQELAKLYDGAELRQMRLFVRGLDDTNAQYQTASGNVTEFAAVKEFLAKRPVFQGDFQPHFDHAIKTILTDLQDPNKKANEFAKMTVALGDCPTPVNEYIADKIIELNKNNPDIAMPFILKRALKDKINKTFGYEVGEVAKQRFEVDRIGSKIETIEATNALINSVMMPNSESIEDNRLKIAGDRLRCPSSSEDPEFGFRLFEESDRELLEKIAKMFCKENQAGALEKNEFGGQSVYEIDQNKLDFMMYEYAKSHGLKDLIDKKIVTHFDEKSIEVDKVLQNFEKDLQTKINAIDKEQLMITFMGDLEKELKQECLDVVNFDNKKGDCKYKLCMSDDVQKDYDQFLTDYALEFRTTFENAKPELERLDRALNAELSDTESVKQTQRNSKQDLNQTSNLGQLGVIPDTGGRNRANSRGSQASRLSRTSNRRGRALS